MCVTHCEMLQCSITRAGITLPFSSQTAQSFTGYLRSDSPYKALAETSINKSPMRPAHRYGSTGYRILGACPQAGAAEPLIVLVLCTHMPCAVREEELGNPAPPTSGGGMGTVR
jgi:hypothetical protein